MTSWRPTGPLFNFDVHDDVRLLSDATVEKDEVRCGAGGHRCVGLEDMDVWGWEIEICGAGRQGCVGLGVKDVWGWGAGMCGETHRSMGPRRIDLWG